MKPVDPDLLAWDKGAGLLPVTVQHAGTHQVLMCAYTNREALARTLASGELTLWSRSRQRLWVKGETSGHRIRIECVMSDCDQDALLMQGWPEGPVCHTGAADCFGGAPDPGLPAFLGELERIIDERLAADPAESYTARLAVGGLARLAQKVGEEGVEVALAAQGPAAQLTAEAADLVFHLLVLLRRRGLGLADVERELRARHEA
ncbi:MAG: bifunctional phosphoribosyl-AMP cyclohydrolase/phosphoribosyl-ATP diphosphatase HisIE [Proteobacteria bacterium]|nr:bifunctional phosphoribosyl-AMP cyclohydrolase/phosphoribosyl-ATP diphosphatase HisIE [Pseudomonadota bacterium]